MPEIYETLMSGSQSEKIKKEINYLQKQFPWKSHEELSSIFSKTGDINYKALKQICTVHIPDNEAND